MSTARGLFDRNTVLTVGVPGQPGKSFRAPMRISFQIKMSRTATPNKAVITVYNVNENTCALFQKPGVVVSLTAGYDIPRQIFTGKPIPFGVKEVHDSEDRVLTVEASDGLDHQRARINVTFATATSLSQVLAAVNAQLGLPTGTLRITNDIQFPHGVTLCGTTRDVLDRIAMINGADWFVRDGVLQMCSVDGDTGELAVQFSTKNKNLIGSPTPKGLGLSKTLAGIEITGLLEPSLRPGMVFSVASKNYNGLYVAQDVEFIGDSGFDNSYYVKVAGTPRR